MKLLGVERILSASAVGSLQEKYAPLDMVIPDQFFDRTRGRVRESTFFGEGIVAHIAFAPSGLLGAWVMRWKHRAAASTSTHIAVELTSAWKARHFQPSPNRTSIARGAWTLSA
jgi:purine nucleoside phosphorylase